MHLIIDLRFYSPEPYGISIYIANVFEELIPLFEKSEKFSKITLILNQKNQNLNLNQYLNWWKSVDSSSKFNIFYTDATAYSLKEQTKFYFQLTKLNPDLVYFFTFNFPILFSKKFVYQCLDMTQANMTLTSKVSLSFRLKVKIANLVMGIGLKKASKVLLLGSQTGQDIARHLNLNLIDSTKPNYIKNTIIWSGVSKRYRQQEFSNSLRSQLLNQNFSLIQKEKAEHFLETNRINKPYFLFVSVFKVHKNVDLLAKAFDKFSKTNPDYQLVLVGNTDEKQPQILESIKQTKAYQKSRIIHLKNLADSDLIFLHDHAEALVMPSTSEGLGLSLIESATRGTPIICSDIKIFRDVFGGGAFYFEVNSGLAIQEALENFIQKEKSQITTMVLENYQKTLGFSWKKVAKDILENLQEAVSR